jgi:hypothetical protein
MPTYLIKPTREDDFYVAFSTITDSPHVWGTREQFENGTAGYFRGHRDEDIPDRLARCDALGSSVLGFDAYRFDDGPLLVRWSADGSEEIGAHLIDHANIRRWLEDGDDTLLRPIPPEET